MFFVMDQFSEKFEVHIATVHELVHKKNFLIETLLKMRDSSVRSPEEVESITFKSVLIRNFFVIDRFMYTGNSR